MPVPIIIVGIKLYQADQPEEMQKADTKQGVRGRNWGDLLLPKVVLQDILPCLFQSRADGVSLPHRGYVDYL
jgi:hypothetical protein